MITSRFRFLVSVLVGVLALGVLTVLTAAAPPALGYIPLTVLFAALNVLLAIYSVPIGGGRVSLMPMVSVAAYLVLGKVLAGWVVVLSMVGHAGVRCWRAIHDPTSREPQGRHLIEVTAFNIAMHITGLLAAAVVFEALHAPPPLMGIGLSSVVPIVLTCLLYLGINYGLAAVYLALWSEEAFSRYIAALPPLFFFEGGPVIFAPLIAIIHNRLGLAYFALAVLAAFVASLVSHDLAETSHRLQRRVRELGSLQAMGQALSASLDVETVVSAIYEQVANLMPASSFYLALYDAQLDEVSFPLVVEDGQRVVAQSRRARHGLTEYLLETKSSLLIPRDVGRRVQDMGLERIGRDALCWLGVPILAGGEVLGTITVQSYDAPDIYDHSHVEIMELVAAQAAVAIQNARLYERTDEALARRVQELDSILRTTQEGVLLIDLQWRVLAVNRALSDALGVAQVDFARHPIDVLRTEGPPLIDLIRYRPDTLQADCERLTSGEIDVLQKIVVLDHTGQYVERTLAPVRDRAGAIIGWLMLFRDLTEELELERLRVDMIDMLVHDLRSPMSLVMASLAMLPDRFEREDREQHARLVGIARRSSERILHLVDELMDISQLERGQLPLTCEPTAIRDLFHEIAVRYSPVATSSDIDLSVEAEDGLPSLYVDRSLVSRVLANLVDNALKFTPDGGEVVMWARSDPPAAPTTLLIGVRDTGPGIPGDAMPQLFEKFQQIASIKGRRRGTGLGLPFCKLAVEAHGGQIWVESDTGQGSCFIMRLPTVNSDEMTAALST